MNPAICGVSEPAAHDIGMDNLHLRVLARAVALASGCPEAHPRPVQVEMATSIAAAMRTASHTALEAGVGTGKTLSYLVPAALRAALAGERTVISTESLSLQAQLIDKDLPIVAQAVTEVTGKSVSFSVLKGWSNFVCADAAVTAARTATGYDPEAPVPSTPSDLQGLADRSERALASVPSGQMVSGRDGNLVSAAELGAAAVWGLREVAARGRGDRHSHPDTVSGPVWDAVSVSASDCLRAGCPLREMCLPVRARRRAADADIVVVNHALLAVQAAKRVPVVLSSRTLGQFHHLVVDEAHGLAGVVRDQGAVTLSGRRVRRLRASLVHAVDVWARGAAGTPAADTPVPRDPASVQREKRALVTRINTGVQVAGDIDRDLGRWRDKTGRDRTVGLAREDAPFEVSGPLLSGWLEDMRSLLRQLNVSDPGLTIARLTTRLYGRIHSLAEAAKLIGAHRVGVARWLELDPDDGELEAKATPVDVADALRAQLWTSDVVVSGEDSDTDSDADAAEPSATDTAVDAPLNRMNLSVTCVSATLPEGFTRQVGINARLTRLGSPLTDTYSRCAVLIPRPTDSDLTAMSDPYRTGRRFDTKAHATWAVSRVVDLVEANGGSALVLAATSSAGREYVAALRASAKGWRVLSQWDGRTTSAVTADWRGDIPSVLVGTRSCMSGLDAPGSTCTLVVIDRPPRAAGNPVDDARKELLMQDLGLGRWEADRRVYAADAAVLFAQAVGRLVRSSTDRGMVAILDPRLRRNNEFSYQETTRRLYIRAVDDFGTRIHDFDEALRLLRAGRPAA